MEHRNLLRTFARGMALLWLSAAQAAASDIAFTVTMSEPVIVTGQPQIAVDVGGAAKQAAYRSGSGTSTLTFAYTVQSGDFDADGITLSPSISVPTGSSITDLAGNPLSNTSFTAPNTTGLKVQTYTASFDAAITNANAGGVSFTISKLPNVAGNSYSYSYTISSANGGSVGATDVSYSASSVTVSNIDLSGLAMGELTLTVTVKGPSGTGTPVIAKTTPSFISRPLDNLPAAATAYSVRQLSSAYSGPLLRVRRASDSQQKDVWADLTGALSLSSLTSFCGTGYCFISTWYDQSGNNKHATPPAGGEPRIVNAGVVELLGSKPAVRYFGSQWLSAPNPLSNANEFTIAMAQVERSRAYAFAWLLLDSTLNTLRVIAHAPWVDGSLYYDLGTNGSPYRISRGWTVAVNVPALLTFRNSASAGTRSVYLNGSLFLSGTGFAAPSDIVKMGMQADRSDGEFLLFPASLSDANRLALERDQGSYFGISVP